MNASLLVPMRVDALVVTADLRASVTFAPFELDYTQLAYFASPEPDQAPETAPPLGVHLHWTLPDALRQGGQPGADGGDGSGSGSTAYPLVPNRWLVVRMPTDQTTPSATAWLVESDYLDATMDAGTSAAFLDPVQGTPTRMGRVLPLPLAAEPDPAPGTPFLRAAGPGNATFSAFAPASPNVFSFVDDLAGLDDAAPTLTYVVLGWHADPASDPLAATTWSPGTQATGASNPTPQWSNDTFAWLLCAEQGTQPTQVLVHGFVSGVVPFPEEDQLQTHFPDDIATDVRVAVGNTATEALGALLADQFDDPAEGDLLVAFEYGLLDVYDQPGSAELLDLERRRRWYGGSAGGTRWEVVPPKGSAHAVPSADQVDALAALNEVQAELDRQGRILESMEWDRYAMWWKQERWSNAVPLSFTNVPKELSTFLDAQLGTDVTAVPTAQQAAIVDGLAAEASAIQAGLMAALARNGATLREVPLPAFAVRKDPVVLVTGLGRAETLNLTGAVWCRLTGQVVTALEVDGTTYAASSLSLPSVADPRLTLPDGADALLTEAGILATNAIQVAGGDAQAVASAVAVLPALPSTPSTAFAPAAFAALPWAQPWVPLYLEWQVAVLQDPAYTGPAHGQQFAPPVLDMTSWAFDGTSYTWPKAALYQNDGAPVFTEAATSMTLTGRTLLTPYLASSLADRLEDYVQQHGTTDPTAKELLAHPEVYSELLAKVSGMDILSQRLSGLLAMLVQRDHRATNAPPDGLVPPLHGHPMPSFETLPVFDFAPLCGTFFVFQGLDVVDSFGRTTSFLVANGSTSSGGEDAEYDFYPVTSPAMAATTTLTGAPPGDPCAGEHDPELRMVQLPPGPVQDARLELTLLAADGTDSDLATSAGTTPVCGWLVPNHVDRSLALYAADGTAWGELRLAAQVAGGYLPTWTPDPTNPGAPATLDDLPNPWVKDMMAGLAGQTDPGAALADLLAAVDLALWTINPRGRHSDQEPALLIGRPLALVRLRLGLRLRGTTFTRQDWWDTYDIDPASPPRAASSSIGLGRVDGGVGGYRWPVRLGSTALRDDGLLGYYPDDTTDVSASFATLHAVALPEGATSGYLSLVQPGSYPTLAFVDDTVTDPDPTAGQVLSLTALVDPRGSVHAFTGILPVASVELPQEAVGPPLASMRYLFRAGPFLTSPDAVRLPRPATHHGTWGWYDPVADATTPLPRSDAGTRLTPTAPRVTEGWLTFTPHPHGQPWDTT